MSMNKNIYLNTLVEYIFLQWKSAYDRDNDFFESRIIVHSLPPEQALKLFLMLDKRVLSEVGGAPHKNYFRVSTGLYEAWVSDDSSVLSDFSEKEEIDLDTVNSWIDTEDQLTWYRNRTCKQEGVASLFVLLVGLEYATDQGGLSDFYIVTPETIWRDMDKGFNLWVTSLLKGLGVSAPDSQIDSLDDLLQKVMSVKALTLQQVSNYISDVFGDSGGVTSVSDVCEALLNSFGLLDLPYFDFEFPEGILVKKNMRLFFEAERFLSHSRYKTNSQRNKDKDKVELAVLNGELSIPLSKEGKPGFDASEEYCKCLIDFIENASVSSRDKLLLVDLFPLMNILGTVPKSEGVKSKKTPLLSGSSSEVFIAALWRSLVEYLSSAGRFNVEKTTKMTIEITHFEHDLVDGDESHEGESSEFVARELIKGVLGGIEERLGSVDVRFPVDREQMREDWRAWERDISLCFVAEFDVLSCSVSRKRPALTFDIIFSSDEPEDLLYKSTWKWALPSNHPERVRLLGARNLSEKLKSLSQNDYGVLPFFKIPDEFLTALYYAADDDEANRLLSQVLIELEVVNLVGGIGEVDAGLQAGIHTLSDSYKEWLNSFLSDGFYSSSKSYLANVIESYQKLAEDVLSEEKLGSQTVLRRLYKSYLISGKSVDSNQSYLDRAVVWGLSPAFLEMESARIKFLIDGFPEIVAHYFVDEKNSNLFDRLLELSTISRPISILCMDDTNQMTAETKDFGYLSYIGMTPQDSGSVAVQTLLREDVEEEVSELIRSTEEQSIVSTVLEDYYSMAAHSHDGISILAVNVKSLNVILAGLDAFLVKILNKNNGSTDPFSVSLNVFSTSSSPKAMEVSLDLWKNDIQERFNDVRFRRLDLKVAHRYVAKGGLLDVLKRDESVYDLAFLFSFLSSSIKGSIISTDEFSFDFHGDAGSQFPISEYPRPIRDEDRFKRFSILSNRRLRIQTRHADMSARLRTSSDSSKDHLVIGHVDYQPWKEVVDELHNSGNWVASIDPFIDKKLLLESDDKDRRKVVSFSTGLGAFGELNLTVSSSFNSSSRLIEKLKSNIKQLLPHADAETTIKISNAVANHENDLIGFSSIKSIMGQDSRNREIVGFTLIDFMYNSPGGLFKKIIPLDSHRHWFTLGLHDISYRPDLLMLELVDRGDNTVPLIKAEILECKFAKQSESHIDKAINQVTEGIKYLGALFRPSDSTSVGDGFDRRYWWGQLQRSLVSRSSVNLNDQQLRKLENTLAKLSEGYYEIEWRGTVFTFWTDVELSEPKVSWIPVSNSVAADQSSKLMHVELGFDGLSQMLSSKGQFENYNVEPPVIIQAPVNGYFNDVEGSGSHFLANTSNDVQADTLESETSVAYVETKIETGLDVLDQNNIVIIEPLGTPNISEDTHHEMVKDEIENTKVMKGNSEPISDLENIQSVLPASEMIPEKILLGTRINNEPVFWYYGHDKLPNRHMVIFGSSGSGKTYGIQCLLSELAKSKIHSFVIDYTDGFLPTHTETGFKSMASPRDHFIRNGGLAISPFRRQTQILDPSMPVIEESSYDVATRIQSIFSSIYSLGEQQKAALVRVISFGLDSYEKYTFDQLVNDLRDDSSYGETVANKIEPFVRANAFVDNENVSWKDLISSPDVGVDVIQLKGYASDIQKIITEFALWDIWDFSQNEGTKNNPMPIVLDEIQNLDHSSDSPIDKMLREGRKFGLGMLLATQTVSQFNSEEKDRLFQAGHKLFFKPASTEIESYAKILSNATGENRKSWVERLSKLEKGQCWSLGSNVKSNGKFIEEAILVNVSSLESRMDNSNES
ncbi:MAG: ATP-binding protein [Motiliproteus sp.]